MKNFTMRDEEFICDNCQRKVYTLKYTARDHCPYCLYSKHLGLTSTTMSILNTPCPNNVL